MVIGALVDVNMATIEQKLKNLKIEESKNRGNRFSSVPRSRHEDPLPVRQKSEFRFCILLLIF